MEQEEENFKVGKDDITELFAQLHHEIGKDLLKRVQTGKATHQELAQAIAFLKSNNITSSVHEDENLKELQRNQSIGWSLEDFGIVNNESIIDDDNDENNEAQSG